MIEVRAARPDEADLITALAMRSKAHWGYSAEFMERSRPILTVTPGYVGEHPVFVATAGARLLGFYSLRVIDGELELDLLFVEPSSIGSGVGGVLMRHALEQAAATGHRYMVVESDPQAEPFYARFGGRRIGVRASTVEAGRELPVLRFELSV